MVDGGWLMVGGRRRKEGGMEGGKDTAKKQNLHQGVRKKRVAQIANVNSFLIQCL